MRFSLEGGTIPLLTSKRVAWKTCFHELMWFVRGQVDNHLLQEKGVHIWDGNSTREFLDGRGLHDYPEGVLGPIYGWQWRTWNKEYNDTDPFGKTGIDQLQQVIEMLKDPAQRSSRRMLISAWNPEQLDKMALPPCHVMMQFHVRQGEYLSCALFQRSGDVGLGVPFNIASYAFLTHLLAKHCGLIAEELVYFLGDAHVYEAHIEPLRKQLTRKDSLFRFPKIRFTWQREAIEEYDIGDIEWIEQYQYHDTIKMQVDP
jgi:thymidylate synthase